VGVSFRPTAKQLVLLEHDTPCNSLCEKPGTGFAADHAEPFHRVITFPSTWFAFTAAHTVLDAHDTATYPWSATVDQLTPFQCSVVSPTARQSVLLKHDTDQRVLPGTAVVQLDPSQCSMLDDPTPKQSSTATQATAETTVGGLATVDQATPSQRSAKGDLEDVDTSSNSPTATQFVLDAHDTLENDAYRSG
jgi:hypothetical protein